MKEERKKKADIAEIESTEQNSQTANKTAKERKKELKLQDQEERAQRNADNSHVPSDKYKYLIKNRQVRKHTRRHKAVVTMMIFLAVTILLGGSVYGMLTFLEFNNFKVLVDKEGMNILSLSNSQDFSNPSEVISLGGPKYMDNISLMDMYYLLPEIEKAEGTYGDARSNYIAATFYLKNVSDEDHVYSESVVIDEITKDMDKAIRIMIIRNGTKTVYAREKDNGEPEEVVPGQMFTEDGSFTKKQEEVWMTTPFSSQNYACYNSGLQLASGQQVKYTILIWLEGWDSECIDPILGGTLKLEMIFKQID